MSAPDGNTGTSGTSPPVRQVKVEMPRIPSPTPSCLTTATLLKPGRPPSPTPSCSTTVLFGTRGRGSISVKPLSSILDQDDQLSTIATASNIPKTEAKDESNNWRSSIKCVGDRLKYIYENDDTYQDVIFEVDCCGSKEQYKAHKLILRIASPVFDRIFKTNPSIVPVKDVEPSTFKRMLKFIYTDEIDVTGYGSQDLLPLLQAAKIYDVKQLYLECVKLLKTSMSDDTAVILCDIAASYADKILLDAALDHIANKAFQIFPSENFLRLSLENVYRLFIRDDLRIDEVTLFEAAVKWGEHHCTTQGLDKTPHNLRKVMQCLIPEIRFPLMRPDEFTLLVIPTKLLTSEEQVGIYQYMCVDTTKQDKLPPISFKITPRQSKKCADLDSSSDDYRDREGSSASPEQLPSLPSKTNNDITTTEAESETASNVSTYSDLQKRPRKYERSHSHSSSASMKKRRKIEEVKKRRKSEDKRNISINDLFDGFNNNRIKLENTSIALNSFISALSQLDNKHEIESIKLENVKIEDSKKLDGRKVYFPRLKYFELNIQIEESISAIILENSFELEKYLFFDCKHNSWLYEKLWSMGIDITLVINKVIVLRLSHENSHVILNKFNGAPAVLKSLKDQFIKSLVYSHTHFADKKFPLSLHRMVILGVVSSICMSSFIKKFKQLKELTVVSPVTTMEGSVRALTLDTEFSSKDKIRKLGLGSFKLHLEPSIRFYNIVTLSLWRVTWEAYFEDKFHHTFPKLQELYLIGPTKGSSKLLKNIFKIGSLTLLISWNCDYCLTDPEGSEIKRKLIEWGLSESEKSFVLKKRSDKSGWEGSKMEYKDFNYYVYKQFEYEFLYEDLHTFTNTS